MSGRNVRSFADPDTHFTLIKSDTSVEKDGVRKGEPTGEVECDECGRVAAAPEYIPHTKGCSQSDVGSDWYYQVHPVPEVPDKEG